MTRPPHTDPSPLLSVERAAAYLGMSRSWTYENAAELGGSRIGGRIKFPLDRLLDYIERQQIATPEPTPIRTATPPAKPRAVGGRTGINPVTLLPWDALG